MKTMADFYPHPQTADGRLGKCHECTKVDVRANRRLRIDYYRTQERLRIRRPSARPTDPVKKRACDKAWKALHSGRLLREPCEVCKSRAEMHHPDYSKPLEVRWLCKVHHEAVHHAEAA